MENIKIKVFAKVNLGLDIVGIYDDGYHNLNMLMASVDIFDIVEAHKSDESVVFMDGVCAEKTNTASKALRLLEENFGIKMSVYISKGIPMNAGLGGSSADASAVFWCASQLFGVALQDFENLALMVGCDTPYMLYGGAAVVKGRGEIVEPCDNVGKMHLLVAQKKYGASTAEVYKNYDKNPIRGASIDALINDIGGNKFFNVLQNSAIELCPSIAETVEDIKKFTPKVFMSGSGSSVVGVFDSIEKAKMAKEQMDKKHYKFVEAVETKDNGIEVVK